MVALLIISKLIFSFTKMNSIIGHDISVDNLWAKLERTPGFSFSKTQFKELANSLNTPDDIVQVLRQNCIDGQLSYSRVVYMLIDDWAEREERNATLNSLTNAMCTSSWRTVSEYLSKEILANNGDQAAVLQDRSKWKTCGTIRFNVAKIIGQGSFGTVVYQGTWNSRNVAVKKIICETGEDSKVAKEINVLLDCDGHENIVKYYVQEKFLNEMSDVPVIFIALELCDFTLKDWMEQRGSCFNIDIHPIEVLHQTTKGVFYLHENKIVHRDIKPENILLVKISGTMVKVKICDFGISRRLSLEKTSLTLKTSSGTLGWMAPEVIQVLVNPNSQTKSKMSTETDIFSLGCLFYYVLTNGIHTFGDNGVEIQSNVLKYRLKIKHGQLMNSYLAFLHLILLMINQNPKKRPSTGIILSHHIFWSAKTKLDFLVTVSSVCERPEPGSQIANCIDAVDYHPLLLHFCDPLDSMGWMRFLCSPVLDFVAHRNGKNRSKYTCFIISDLLRAIRNMKVHYASLPEQVKETVGPLDEPFLDYWLIRFPILLDVVWCVFEHLKKDLNFGLTSFYSVSYDFYDSELSADQIARLEMLVRLHCEAFLSS